MRVTKRLPRFGAKRGSMLSNCDVLSPQKWQASIHRASSKADEET
jgi:hypothetical protein